MSHPVNFGQLIVITSSFCCYTTHNCKKMQKNDFTDTAKHDMGQKRQICKKNLRILKVVAHLFIQ